MLLDGSFHLVLCLFPHFFNHEDLKCDLQDDCSEAEFSELEPVHCVITRVKMVDDQEFNDSFGMF